ncbi:MAG: DUF401 family protein [Phycisphaerae bacterium]|nr:DUF401 family protein [Phycisphaerae bacterium]
MYALIAMFGALTALVILLRLKMRLGRSMVVSAGVLAALLLVGPGLLWKTAVAEWHDKPIGQTTGYLFISLAVLLCMVNVLGLAMRETGVSGRLAVALQGLFRSRRAALTAIPMLMGLLPTPGGIMLSAPMVRDLGDSIGVDRTQCAAINFWFRHQWETIWPLFPSIPLIQSMLGISAFQLMSHNGIILLAGTLGGILFLLLVGIPPRDPNHSHRTQWWLNVRDFLSAFWPIALVAVLYAAINLPPAGGIILATGFFGLFHRLPLSRWNAILRQGLEPDFVLLVLGALLFKLILEAGGAIPSAVGFLQEIHTPPVVLIFLLPLLVAFLTGVTMPTVAITFPFLMPMISGDGRIRMGLETLAFSGLICGLMLTPVHLCLAMSASYFQAPLGKLIVKLLGPVVLVAVAGLVSAWMFP